jgi:tetratricopeptide (TPR) repeat protein
MKHAAAGLMALALFAAGAARASENCRTEVREAGRLLLQNEPASAVERLAALLARKDLAGPCRSDALTVLAEAEEQLGYYAEAARHWKQLLAEAPTGKRELEVLRGVARVERQLGNLSESLKALELLAERQPDALQIGLDIVETAQAMGDELGAARRLLALREKIEGALDFDFYQRFDLVDAAVSYLETLHGAAQATPFERTELAYLFREQGRLDRALETALALEKEQPASAPIQALLGDLYLGQAKLERSLAHYERALDLDRSRQSSRSLEGLGEVFFQRGERDKAVRLWRRIVQPGPRQVFQKLELARIYREHGLYDEALELLVGLRKEKSYRLPEQLYVRQLADTYYIIGQTRKALAELLQLVEQDPSQLDLMQSELQRLLAEDMSICGLLAGLSPSRQSWAAQQFLAQGLGFCGRRREATAHALQAHLMRGQLDAIATLFSELVQDGHHEEATWLEAHLEGQDVADVHLQYYRARLASATGQAEKAASLYRDYLARGRRASAPGGDRGLFDDALFHLAELLVGELRQPAEAAELLTELIVRYPVSTLRPQAEARLGLAMYREGRTDEARRQLDAIGPTNPVAMAMLGQMHFAEGDLDKARITLRRALGEYPDQLGTQPELIALLQVLLLSMASKEESALMVQYRRAALLQDWIAAEVALLQLGQHERWQDYARFEMAALAERQGRAGEAMELYGALLGGQMPDWLAAAAALRLDELYVEAGQPERAIAVLERLILEHSKTPRLAELRQRLTDRKASVALRQQATP